MYRFKTEVSKYNNEGYLKITVTCIESDPGQDKDVFRHKDSNYRDWIDSSAIAILKTYSTQLKVAIESEDNIEAYTDTESLVKEVSKNLLKEAKELINRRRSVAALSFESDQSIVEY